MNVLRYIDNFRITMQLLSIVYLIHSHISPIESLLNIIYYYYPYNGNR